MPFPLNLPKYIDSVVISEGSRHFVVVHGQMILLYAPEFGQTRRIHYFKHSRLVIFPGDEIRVPLSGVVKQLLQKIPKQSAVWND